MRPLCRAARFDGVVPMAEDHALTPDEPRPLIAAIRVYRASSDPFDVAFGFPGLEGKQLTELLPAYAEVGVTWWLECSSWNHSLSEVHERIRRRPLSSNSGSYQFSLPRIDKSVMAP